MRLLTIDPGLRATGLALVVDDVLVGCALARSSPSGTPEPDVYGADEVAAEAAAFTEVLLAGRPPDAVAIEWPRVRPGVHAEDPNDLILLSFVHGLILARLFERKLLATVRAAVPIIPVSADDWTKGVPKEPRQARFLARPAGKLGPDFAKGLTPAERAHLDAIQPPHLRHNTTDAVHLGKWASYPPRLASLLRRATPGAKPAPKRAPARVAPARAGARKA